MLTVSPSANEFAASGVGATPPDPSILNWVLISYFVQLIRPVRTQIDPLFALCHHNGGAIACDGFTLITPTQNLTLLQKSVDLSLQSWVGVASSALIGTRGTGDVQALLFSAAQASWPISNPTNYV
ncbi:unnamed protein product, partial [Iphiclides podalirius]